MIFFSGSSRNCTLLSALPANTSAIVTGTCLGAAIMTVCMGVFANRPLACASGLGVNSMIAAAATGACGGDGGIADVAIA